jgi:NADH-quinone oxidoreductase subunit L
MDKHTEEHVKESPKVITIPLILLAIPSVFAGLFIGSFVFGDYFAESIYVAEHHQSVAKLAEHYHGIGSFFAHAFQGYAVYLAFAGIFCAWFLYMKQPQLAESLKQKLHIPYKVLSNKYGIDELYQTVFADGSRKIGAFCDSFGDRLLIDGLLVNGSAKIINWFSVKVRNIQTGYLYHYAFAMIIGLLILLSKVFLQ